MSTEELVWLFVVGALSFAALCAILMSVVQEKEDE